MKTSNNSAGDNLCSINWRETEEINLGRTVSAHPAGTLNMIFMTGFKLSVMKIVTSKLAMNLNSGVR